MIWPQLRKNYIAKHLFMFLWRMQTKVDLLLEYKIPHTKSLELVNLLYEEATVLAC